MKFLRNLLASVVGFFISIFLILILIIGITLSVNKDSEVLIKEGSILKIKLDSEIKDYAPEGVDLFAEALGFDDGLLGVNSIVSVIEKAKYDKNIEGISIEVPKISAGIAQILEIRRALKSFKESGKFVMSYQDFYGQKEYYLSSVSDSLYLNPLGSVDLKGLSSEILFFKDFQKKYGVKMEVVRHGKYKSAVEPFLENEMSKANRTQISELLHSVWLSVLEGISVNRGVSINKLNGIADNLEGRNADLALKNNLIDGVIYKDEYEEKLRELTGVKKLRQVTLKNYLTTMYLDSYNISKNQVSVIYAQGDIIYGKGDENSIGPELIIKELRRAQKDKNVKAIVLRVNSPGGSALASDMIWREVELTKQEKPVVVSMGNLAASGGYYISSNASYIVAEPSTITGSIGVFGIMPNASELVENIGIRSEKVATNKGASYSVFKPITADYYKVTKEGVDAIYSTFVNKVASGRNMSYEAVHEIAQGRVWSGKQAVQNGLVDELGGLDTAIERAAAYANITDYKIENYPDYEKDLEESFKKLPFVNSEYSFIKKALGMEESQLFETFENTSNLKGIQARLPFVLNIK